MKSDRVLEEIKSKTDIIDFISDFVQLKKSGQNWKGLCPFHAEKTPSFVVNGEKQTFHCFGCGTGGDVISFLMKYENLSFPEALRLLAKKAGVPLPERGAGAGSGAKEEKIRSALSEAAGFYKTQLAGSAAAMDYVKRRGISSESVTIFGIGYAPTGWSNLIRHLKSRGFGEETMRDAGLAVQGERGLYDMFRERVIFPITSAGGNVVAFGGRALGDAMPKYINSPETPVFRKSETLFGLAFARETIRREGFALIVEGYMDAVICHQFGFRNAVAPLGTSLTSGQIRKLRNLAGRAILVFDGDAAGRAAAKRALALVCRDNYSARVLVLPDGEDPDSYLRKEGEAAFAGLIDGARTMVDFLVGSSGVEKRETVREVLTLISQVSDPLLSEEMLMELADRTRMNEAAIRAEFGRIRNRGTANVASPGPSSPGRSGEEYLLLLSSVIAFPEKAGEVLSRLDLKEIEDKTMAGIFRKLSSQGGGDISLLLRDGDEDERKLVTKLSVDPGFDRDNVDSNIEGCFRKIEMRKFEEKLSVARNSGDFSRFDALLRERKKYMEGMKDA